MSRRRRAGCFLPAEAARRQAVTGGGGGGVSKMAVAIGGVSEQKIQDFQPSVRCLSPINDLII